MATISSTTNPADFAFRRQQYLERKMLKTLLFQLRFEQFSQKKSAPAKGTSSVRFFRARKAAKAGTTATGGAGTGVQNLTEGGQSAHNTKVGIGHLDCYFNQRGDDFSITDIAEATDVLDALDNYTKTLGDDAALDYDSVIQASIMGNATTAALATALGLGGIQTTLYNSNNLYGITNANYFERFAGVVNSGNSANDFATLSNLQPGQAKFTRLEGLRAITQLRSNDVKPKDGKVYACVCPSLVMFDIRQDSTLVGAMQYRDNKALYNWEEFTLDGAAYMETTNPWQETATSYGTYTAGGNILTNMYIGDDPFGTVMIDDKRPGGSPAAPKLKILDQADKSDIYNQTIVGAWKAYYGSILLLTSDASDVPHVVASRVQTTFR